MKKMTLIVLCGFVVFSGCKPKTNEKPKTEPKDTVAVFDVKVDRFADIQILRYELPGLDKLSTKQKELVYYLSQAALCGRDITYAQNYRHNIQIRGVLEEIYQNYKGDTSSVDWKNFVVYLKRFWVSNGIHHHYSEKKLTPDFNEAYFKELISGSANAQWPLLKGESTEQLWTKLIPIIFDPKVDAKAVVKDKGVDKIATSANNFYGKGITEKEVEKFYSKMKIGTGDSAVSFGLNSRLVKEKGKLVEKVYKVDGLYGKAIEQIIVWLKKAEGVAENEDQKKYLELLIKYYETGDLKVWDDCNIQWVKATAGDIDFINGFIEVYGDPLGYRGSYESVVQINDFDASEKMKVMAENAQWFEDHSPIMRAHKRDTVKGISYKVVNVAMESGDAAPSTPVGINLPNANWIRSGHGSKSVSLGNIVGSYNAASSGNVTDEFYHGKDVIERLKKHGKASGKLHTAMHEVIGHASGKINPGVGTDHETLKNYSSTLEEARADLVALYYAIDPKLVELGLMENLDVGMSEYDAYIANGLFLQLRRLDLGENLEEDHMRNRHLIASWVYEKGRINNVIEKKSVKGKTFFVVNDYAKLRILFGELLREIQRIKSEGDFQSAETLVETYGVKVDPVLHAEVLERFKHLNLAPYSGFVQPILTPVFEGEVFKDLKVTYESNFANQMLLYSRNYGFLPVGE
jgi:dipeptidyl-peptidase-3